MSDFLVNLVRRGVGAAPVARARPVAIGPVVAGGPASPGIAGSAPTESRSSPPSPTLPTQPGPAPSGLPAPIADVPALAAAAPPVPVPAVADALAPSTPPRGRTMDDAAESRPSTGRVGPRTVAATPPVPATGRAAKEPAATTAPRQPVAALPAPLTLEGIVAIVAGETPDQPSWPPEPEATLADPEPAIATPARGESPEPDDRPRPAQVRTAPRPSPAPQVDLRHELPSATVHPAPPPPIARPSIDLPAEPRIEVRIGTIEILGGDPPPVPPSGPVQPAVAPEPAAPAGFDAFLRLRTYAPWAG